MTALATASVFEALSKVCADATSVKAVLGVDIGGAGTNIVAPLADDLPDTPAILIVPGAWTNIAGGAARVTYTAHGSIWVDREHPGDASVELMNIFDALIDAFAARAKAYEPTAALQSVLITDGPGLSEAEWPAGSEHWYLTWPFDLEIKVNPNNLIYRAQ